MEYGSLVTIVADGHCKDQTNIRKHGGRLALALAGQPGTGTGTGTGGRSTCRAVQVWRPGKQDHADEDRELGEGGGPGDQI